MSTGWNSDGITRQSPRAVVVGIGTVGLRRALSFDDAGLAVTGYDVDESVVDDYRRGVDATGAVGDDRVGASECAFTTDPDCVRDADVVFVAVPTQYDAEGEGPLPTVQAAAETIGEHLSTGTTAVLESTVPPGGVRDVFTPALEAAAAPAPREFAVAYSPVRLSPGGPDGEWRTRTKLVAAERAGVARAVATLFERVYDSVEIVEDPATAAAAKCVENVYRDVNVALVNELAAGLGALGLNADRVLDAAATKWNVPRFDHGLVGGNCLPDDSRLFADRVARAGGSSSLVRTARGINDAVPERVADRTVEALAARYHARERSTAESTDGDRPVAADGSGGTTTADGVTPDATDAPRPTVLLLGLAYKPDVADLSGTESVAVATALHARGVDVVGYDPLVDPERADEELPFEVRASRPFEGVDGVAVLVGHGAFEELTLSDLSAAGDDTPAIVDVPGVFDAGRRDATSRAGAGAAVYRGW